MLLPAPPTTSLDPACSLPGSVRSLLTCRDGENIEEYDERLRIAAFNYFGFDVSDVFTIHDRSGSIATRSTYSGRSHSSDSQASNSTALTSSSLRSEKDYPPAIIPDQNLQFQLSTFNSESFQACKPRTERNSISFPHVSPLTQPKFSQPRSQPTSRASSPKGSCRRLSFWGNRRHHCNETSAARHPPNSRDVMAQRRAVQILRSGHHLCTKALRHTVKVALSGPNSVVPSCCDAPSSGDVAEAEYGISEPAALHHKSHSWDQDASFVITSNQNSGSLPRPSLQTRFSVGMDSFPDPLGGRILDMLDRQSVAAVRELHDFKELLQLQLEQWKLFGQWAQEQEAVQQAEFIQLKVEQLARHKEALQQLADKHMFEMTEAEDKQVKAETDMRALHLQRERDVATGLKHMEAYCAGVCTSSGEPHNRPVTEHDLAKLQQARHDRDLLARRHHSAVEVLRGEQTQRLRARKQRQILEKLELEKAHQTEEQETQLCNDQKMLSSDEEVAAKHCKMLWRWELQTAIYLKSIGYDLEPPAPSQPAEGNWSSRHDSMMLASTATTPSVDPEPDLPVQKRVSHDSTSHRQISSQPDQTKTRAATP